MSFLDDLKATLSDLFKQPGAVGGGGQGVSLGGRQVTPQAAGAATAPIVEPVLAGAAATGQFFQEQVIDRYERPFIMAYLMNNPDTYAEGRADNPVEAWKWALGRADQVAFSEAFNAWQAKNPGAAQSLVPGQFQFLYPVLRAVGAFPNADIYDDEEVQKAYRDGSINPASKDFRVSKLASLSSSVAFSFIDPLVIGGKVAKLARLRKIDGPIEKILQGDELRAYNATKVKQQRAETLLTQRLARLDDLQRRLDDIDGRIAAGQNSGRPDLGPAPNFDDAYMRARDLLTEGRDIPVDENSVIALANDIFARQTDEYNKASSFIEPELTKRTQEWGLERENLLKQQEKLLGDITRVQQIVDKTREASVPKYASNIGHFIDQIIKYDMRASEIAKHRLLNIYSSDPYRAATVLEYAAKSKNPDDLTDALMVLGWGDEGATQRLIQRRASMQWVLERAQGNGTLLDDALQAQQRGMTLIDYRQSDEYKNIFNERMSALIAEDNFLRNLVGDLQYDGLGRPVYRTAGFMLGDQLGQVRGLAGGRVGAVLEPIRARRAIRKANYDFLPSAGKGRGKLMDGWDQISYSSNPMLPAIHVMEFVGAKLGREAPSGWLNVRGVEEAEGVDEMISFLQANSAWNNMESVGLKKALLADFINAAPGAQRRMAAERIEESAITSLAKSKGFDPEVYRAQADDFMQRYRDKIDEADAFQKSRVDADGTLSKEDFDEYRRMRDEAKLEMIEAKAKENEAKAVEQLIRDMVSQYRGARQAAIDDVRKTAFAKTTDDGVIYSPLLLSQLDTTHFLPDMAALDEFFTANKNILESATKELVQPSTTGVKNTLEAAYREFDSMWRPAVLLRLGYAQRNVLISGLQAASALEGGITALWGEKAQQAFRNWSTNRWDRIVQMRANALQTQRMKNTDGMTDVLPRRFMFRVNAKDYNDFLVDNLELARANLDEAMATKGTPGSRGRIKAAKELVANAERELVEYGEYLNRLGSKTNRARIGRQSIVIGSEDVAGAFQGLHGQAFMDAVSSNARLSYDLAPAGVRGIADAKAVEAGLGYGALNPKDYGYWEELTKVVNKQLKNSFIPQMIFQGKTMPEMLAYLRTAQGKAEMRDVNWRGLAAYLDVDPTPENYLTRIVGSYDRYLPNERARNLVLKAAGENRDITVQELRTVIRNSEAPADVVGVKIGTPQQATTAEKLSNLLTGGIQRENLGKIGIAGVAGFATGGPVGALAGVFIGQHWTRITQKVFKYLSALPEDTLIRHPFANALYEAQVNGRVAAARQLGEDLTGTQLATIEESARKFAVRETRSYLYTVIRRNGIASTTTGLALSPFFQAQLHTVKAWSRIAWEQPQRVALVAGQYARFNNSQIIHEDPETGQRYIVVHIPDAVANALPKGLRDAILPNNQWRLYTSSFNLIAPGWRGSDAATGIIQSIGIGPVAALSLQEIAKRMPDMDQQLSQTFGINVPLKKYLSKFVPDEAISDTALSTQLLPPTLRRIQSLYRGSQASKDGTFTTEYDGPADFAYYWKYYYDYRYARMKSGLDPTQTQEQLWSQAREDTQYFFAMRFLANLTLPFIPQYTGALTPLYGEYRRLQSEDPMQAFDRFMDQYGSEFIHLTSSLTNNWSGANANEDAVFMAKENADLLSDLLKQGVDPEFAQMVTNRMFTDVEYDPASRVWQIENNYRGRVSPQEAARLTEIRVGWYYYRKLQEQIDAELSRRGLTSIAQKDAADLAAWKKQNLGQLASAFPAWYAEGYTSFSSSKWETSVRVLETLLADKKFMSLQGPDSWFNTASMWLDMRNQVAAEVARRGKGDIDSDSNADLRIYVDDAVGQLKQLDPNFARMYDRFFERDPYKVPVMKGFER